MLNKVLLIGRITKEVELKKGSTDSVFAPFTVAVNREFSHDEVDFLNCITFGKQAENLTKYCNKGSLIAIVGRLQCRSYQAQDGTTRNVVEVIADKITFLNPKSKNEADAQPYDFENPNTQKNENLPF